MSLDFQVVQWVVECEASLLASTLSKKEVLLSLSRVASKLSIFK